MSDGRPNAREEIEEVTRRLEAIRAGGQAEPARSPSRATERPGYERPSVPPSAQDPERVAARVDAIAVRRGPRQRDLSITALVGAARDGAERTQRRLGELIELWEQVVPADLLPHTTLGAFRGGVLHVHVDSSAVAYELDRLLREGLTAELRRRSRATLSRVRITQAATPTS